MGSSGSTPTESLSVLPSSRKTLEDKLDTAGKTGVLNVAKQELKSSSVVWVSLSSPEYAAKIKLLDISSNAMKTLPPQLLLMSNLKTLNASSCSIQKTNDLSTLIALKQADLSRNDLEDNTLGVLSPSILKLNISSNHLMRFPARMSNLVNLQELDLSGNRLESIDGIGSLVAIVILTLDDNQLVDLPSEIMSLVRLKKLSMKRNLLIPKSPQRSTQSIPEELFTQTTIDTLELEGNNYIKKADILAFDGVDIFLERRRKSKERNIQGGAMTDLSLFGIE